MVRRLVLLSFIVNVISCESLYQVFKNDNILYSHKDIKVVPTEVIF